MDGKLSKNRCFSKFWDRSMINHGYLWPQNGKQIPLWFIYYLTWCGERQKNKQQMQNQPPRVKLSCKPRSLFSWTWLTMKINQSYPFLLDVLVVLHTDLLLADFHAHPFPLEKIPPRREALAEVTHLATPPTSPRDSATVAPSELLRWAIFYARRPQMFEFGQSSTTHKKTTWNQSSPEITWHKMLYDIIICDSIVSYTMGSDRIIQEKNGRIRQHSPCQIFF